MCFCDMHSNTTACLLLWFDSRDLLAVQRKLPALQQKLGRNITKAKPEIRLPTSPSRRLPACSVTSRLADSGCRPSPCQQLAWAAKGAELPARVLVPEPTLLIRGRLTLPGLLARRLKMP